VREADLFRSRRTFHVFADVRLAESREILGSVMAPGGGDAAREVDSHEGQQLSAPPGSQ
jgi:hypothetical protein